MDLPFSQEKFENYWIRIFSKDVETDELKWHFDNENRKVTVLEGNDWHFQLDDDLPVTLKVGDIIEIPKGIYHRIKRGSNDLKIKIEFYE
jgi:quercetin dioxygenase-like cupin family protein